MGPRALLIGNYGSGNAGDSLLRDYFLWKFPNARWTCMTYRVDRAFPFPQVEKFPNTIDAFLRFRWPGMFVAVARCDVAVFGGGTLFTDAETPLATVDWWLYALMLRVLRKPYVLAFQGIGPFRRKWCERLARWAVLGAAAVSVRDSASFERVKPWRSDVVASFDPIFERVHASARLPARRNSAVVAVPRFNSTDEFFSDVRREAGNDPIVLALFDTRRDKPIERRAREVLKNVARVEYAVDIESIESIFAGARIVITQRYHGAIIARACNIPVRPVRHTPGDKLDDVVRMSKLDDSALLALVRAGEDQLGRFLAAR